MSVCPFCKGQRRTDIGPDQPNGLLCLSCNGTGDYDTMKLLRAYRLGTAQGEARALARMIGSDGPWRELTFETISAAIVDDVRRQLYEDMLGPGGNPERVRLEARLARYEREQGPLLAYVAELAVELRERIEREVPEHA